LAFSSTSSALGRVERRQDVDVASRYPGGRVSTMSILRMYALLTAACTLGLVVIAAFMGIPRR